MSESSDIIPLRPDRPSAADSQLSINYDVVEVLNNMLIEAQAGKIIGLAVIAFDGIGNSRQASVGKITHCQIVGSLQRLQFETMLEWKAKDER